MHMVYHHGISYRNIYKDNIGRDFMGQLLSNAAARRLNRIYGRITSADYFKITLIAKHSLDMDDNNADIVLQVYDNSIYQLIALIVALFDSKELLQALFLVTDPLLLYAFDIMITNSINALERDSYTKQVPKSDCEFFHQFAVYGKHKSAKHIL